MHHRTFKTSDDPYYSEKDFLHAQVFAHVRSLSPRQEFLLKQVDMKDLDSDKIVMFQKKWVFINCTFNWIFLIKITIFQQILLDSLFNFLRTITHKCAAGILGWFYSSCIICGIFVKISDCFEYLMAYYIGTFHLGLR